MAVSFNPSVSSNRNAGRNQKQNFGSFPVPKDSFEARDLLEKAIFGDLKPTPDNIESLSNALKTGKKTISFHLEDLAKLWKKDPEELKK